jgi:putative transcriptional regulator
MSKDAFDGIMDGLNDALAYAEGRGDPATYRVHIPEKVDVKALRKRLGLKQDEFAVRYGFTIGRVRDWEQGRTAPGASDRVLLTVIDREPEAVQRALSAS